MLKAVLTGGIATGKSYVRERFERLGAACFDADSFAHGVMAAGTAATRAIAERFGPSVISTDGSVNRAVLGPMVFADPAARRDLEAIVHPVVYRAIQAALRGLQLSEAPDVAIVEIPLVFETGRASEFDRVVATVCTPEVQLQRLLARGLSHADARRRLESQWPAQEKAARADHVIDTSGAFAETDRQVAETWRLLRQASTSVPS